MDDERPMNTHKNRWSDKTNEEPDDYVEDFIAAWAFAKELTLIGSAVWILRSILVWISSFF